MGYRTSSVAGAFFAQDKAELAASVRALLDGVAGQGPDTPARAVIAPHAGYRFSGALTAEAWAAARGAMADRILILSPSHKHRFDGLAVAAHGAVALPGMRIRLDRAAARALVKAGLAVEDEDAFAQEHGIDTQLPFARALFPKVPVLPVVIGACDAAAVARLVDAVMAMEGETLVVLSSDLSHFLTETEAQKRDVLTAARIEAGQSAQLTGQDACGVRAIAGYFAAQAGAGARPLRLARRTSAAVTGDTSRVVGYGAWAIYGPGQDILSGAMRAELMRVARAALESRLARGTGPQLRVDSFPIPLRTVMASFVTLEIGGRLRGCIGSMAPHKPLVADVVENAVKAGFHDPRFAPLTAAELARITIKLSVLTRPAPMPVTGEADLLARLVPGETGLILADGDRRGVFLPSVWAGLPEPGAFVRALKRKAGLAEDHWSDGMRAHVFRAEYFGEPQAEDRGAA